MRLLLCSASPRRRELLARLGVAFDAVAPKVDESPLPGEDPHALPLRLARLKARAGLAVARAAEDTLALAADTVVAVDGVSLGKPADRAEAADMLARLSGRRHHVVTGVCALAGDAERALTVTTEVEFAPLSSREIAWLAASGDGDDKAGAYALQGLAGAFVRRIDGSWSNVVGLPLTETLALLGEAGVALPWL